MPLAKMEPAKWYKNTVSQIAYPALNSDLGIFWRISEKKYRINQQKAEEYMYLFN
ncbi:MAG: hypothetical protein K8R25_14775 [Methanosarcinales archaeon]|nr:hypothetical protein [Methanosarcinales archaeon]